MHKEMEAEDVTISLANTGEVKKKKACLGSLRDATAQGANIFHCDF